MVVARVLLQHLIERIHRHNDGGIANGVDSELPAQLVAFLNVCVNLLRREERSPTKTRLTLVVHQRPCRRAREPSVRRHLSNRPDPQTIVTVTGFAPELLQLGRALLGLSGRRWVSDLNRCARQLRAVVLIQELPLGVRANHARVNRSTRFNYTRNSELELTAHIIEQAVAHVGGFVPRNQPRVEIRSFADDAIGIALGVPLDQSALRVRRGLVDVGHFQSLAVANRTVATGTRQNHRIIGRRGVKITTQGFFLLLEVVLVPVTARDPFTGPQFLGFLANLLFQLRER